ncbi:unnamed protein product [Cylindrotheca closterium]|uniref:Uncharacterized protein n=1 Tax=Cylindrotheca closterium TaxID=2856 RepID=A0AAD2CLU2_9STRA|nr:unnamed protein product [Cylindrotheca closterium]
MWSSLRKKKPKKSSLLLRESSSDPAAATPPPPSIKRHAATEPRDISNTQTKSGGGSDSSNASIKKFLFCAKDTGKHLEEQRGARRNGSENSTIQSSPPSTASPASGPDSPTQEVTRHLEVVFDKPNSASSRVVETVRRKQPKVNTGVDIYDQLSSPPKKSPRLGTPMKHYSDASNDLMRTPSRKEQQKSQEPQSQEPQKLAPSPDSSSFNSFDFAMPESANDNYLSPSVAARAANRRANAMKTPGQGIPTPHRNQNGRAFPHPLSNLQSPMPEEQVSFEHHISMNGGSIASSIQQNSTHDLNNEDDDALKPPESTVSPQSKTYTLQEVQNMILEAEQKIHAEWTDRHEQELASFEADVEKSLVEQGKQWKKDAEEEYSRLHRVIQREKQMSAQSQERLNQQSKQIFALETQLDEARQQQQVQSSTSAEVQQLRHEKETAESKIEQLEQTLSNMQKLRITQRNENVASTPSEDQKTLNDEIVRLQSEKDLAERKLQQMNSQLADSRKGRAATQVQLRNAKAEIEALQKQMMDGSVGMPSTIFSEASTPLNSNLNDDLKESIRRLEQENSQLLQQQEVLQQQIAAATEAASQATDANNVTKLKKELSQVTKQRDAYEKYVKVLREKQAEELEKAIQAEKLKLQEQYEKENGDGATSATFGTNLSGETGFTAAFAKEEIRLREEFDLHKEAMGKVHKDEVDTMKQCLTHLDELHTKQVELAMLESLENDDNADEIVYLKQQVDFMLESNLLPEGEPDFPAPTNFQNKLDVWKVKHQQALQATSKQLVDTQVLPLKEQLESVQKDLDQLEMNLSEAITERDQVVDVQVLPLRNQLESVQNERDQLEADLLASKTDRDQVVETQVLPLQEKLKSVQNDRDQMELDLTIVKTERDQLEIDLSSSKKETELAKQDSQSMETANKKALEAQLGPLQQDLEATKEERDRLQRDLLQTQAKVEELAQAVEKLQDEKTEMESMKAELNNKLAEIAKLQEEKAGVETRVQELEVMMKDLEVSHSKDVEEVAKGSEAKLEELQNQHKNALEAATSMNKELELTLQETQTKIADMEAKHSRDLESAKLLQESSSGAEEGLEEKLALMESKAEADRADFNRMVKEVRDAHTKEIEELINQLDLVVEEHEEKFKEKDKVIKDKDAVISALGSQLADVQNRLNEMSESTSGLENKLENMKKEIATSRAEAETSKQDIILLMEDHDKEMERQAVLREEACDEAREEMIQRAEVRYDEANQLFRNLKKRFDEANGRIADLEGELKSAKKQSDDFKRKQDAQERQLREDLAQAKAKIATSDANTARLERQYKGDLEHALQSKDEMRMQLEETRATSQQIQSTLAAVVAEKEKLTTEFVEMKAVCEELMAIVEGSAASA